MCVFAGALCVEKLKAEWGSQRTRRKKTMQTKLLKGFAVQESDTRMLNKTGIAC